MLLLQLVVNQSLFAFVDELRGTEADSSEGVVPACGAVFLVVVNVEFEHVTEDVMLRVGVDVEGQLFVPDRIQVANRGPSLPPLAVDVDNDVGTGAAVAVLGDKVVSVDNLHDEFSNSGHSEVSFRSVRFG